MPPKMTTVNIDFVESYDGTRTERFFRLLQDVFDESGVEWTPAHFVKAIDRKIKGAALDVLERDARCRQLMKDARDSSKSVSIEDIKYIELHLTKHFPEANEVKKVVPDELVENLAQGRDEKLEAYSLRTFDILLAFEVTDGTKKSAAENYILKEIINAYGKGLYKKNLRDEICSSRD
ncbi:hypothetical protein K3495_g9252 [Podosphaera aphanis]|nr:hypothetical protein K3495_g9252 [Podosphaera aphanis]